MDINDHYELAFINFGLSLSDQYWFKPIDLNIIWDDINYFNNEYNSEEFFNATNDNGSFTLLRKYNTQSDKYDAPNNSLGGELKKTWVKKMVLTIYIKALHHCIILNLLMRLSHKRCVKY